MIIFTLVMVILIAVIIGIVLWGVPILVGKGLQYKFETEQSAWDYWEKMKGNRWNDLSGEEKTKMVTVYIIIADDIGIITSEKQVRIMLEKMLPINEKDIGPLFIHNSTEYDPYKC